MNPIVAEQFAENKLGELGLTNWRFEFDRSVKRFGCCNYRERKISLSEPLTVRNAFEQVRDMILHEIAHILAGPLAKHGWAWKTEAMKIGCRPKACYSSEDVDRIPLKWKGVCKKCGHVFYRQKRVREWQRLVHSADRGVIDWSLNR